MSLQRLQQFRENLKSYQPELLATGKLTRVTGMLIEAVGCQTRLGGICQIVDGDESCEAEVVGFEGEKILRADLWIRDLASEGKLAGAGVVVINPPWTLEDKLVKALPWLADTLAQGDGYGWRLDGGLTEEDVEELAD